MNFKMIIRTLGTLLRLEAVCMLPSLLVSAIYGQGEDLKAFILSILMLAVASTFALLAKPKSTDIYSRDGFALVGIGWLLLSFFGCLPYFFSGVAPNMFDALFEAISGFSTTGASILTDVESVPKGLVFWRAFTNWMGGMGVLVLMIAVLPSVKANNIHIMQAESPGPFVDKFVPRIGQVAKILYLIYLSFTVIITILLMAGGMPLYDALVHAFGTVSTGGFSSKNLSVGEFNSFYIELVIVLGMLACGVNMSLYQLILRKKAKVVLHDEELKLYLAIVLGAVLMIGINLAVVGVSTPQGSLRNALFQVASVVTTTGFSTQDFNLWPEFSKGVLIALMFIGGSAGSTSGGIKVMRILVLAKTIRKDIGKILHPTAVNDARLNGKPMEDSVVAGIHSFFFLYIFILAISILIVSLDGHDLETAFADSASAIGNIGPALGVAGPMGNFSTFSNLSKATLSICML
ncbi:MAG: TrkH family potassium uptake protein, partial [Clostridiales bacterium]|nr:TrkH family potassium uptake protein [Clostridiales bacterium]